MGKPLECVAVLNLQVPHGHWVIVRVLRDDDAYFATWPYPAVRHGEPVYRYGNTVDYGTVEAALAAAVEAVLEMGFPV